MIPTRLLGITSQAQHELTSVIEAASEAGVRVLTLSCMVELCFENAAHRAVFGKALTEAVAGVIAQHTVPVVSEVDQSMGGRRFRLVLGFYPIPESRGEDTSDG